MFSVSFPEFSTVPLVFQRGALRCLRACWPCSGVEGRDGLDVGEDIGEAGMFGYLRLPLTGQRLGKTNAEKAAEG